MCVNNEKSLGHSLQGCSSLVILAAKMTLKHLGCSFFAVLGNSAMLGYMFVWYLLLQVSAKDTLEEGAVLCIPAAVTQSLGERSPAAKMTTHDVKWLRSLVLYKARLSIGDSLEPFFFNSFFVWGHLFPYLQTVSIVSNIKYPNMSEFLRLSLFFLLSRWETDLVGHGQSIQLISAALADIDICRICGTNLCRIRR